MTTGTTRWSFDTCGCVVLQNYDYDVSDQDPVSITFETICSLHQGIPDHPTRYDVVANKENRPRMNALRELLNNGPASVVDTLPDGTKQLKQGLDVSFSFSGTVPNRLINIILTGIVLTAQQKTAFQTRLDNLFGAGKITLVN